MNKTIGWVVLILVIAGIIWWGNSKPVVVPAGGEPIKIGQMSGHTGTGSDIGTEERNGVIMAVEEINARGGIDGRSIELIPEDAPALDLKLGASVAQKLISLENVLAIIGPQWDGQGEVMATISNQEKVPVISPNVSTDIESKINSPYFFTTWPDNEVGIQRLLEFAKSRGWKKVAIIEPANFSFWLYTANLFEKNAPAYGVEIVAREMGTDFGVFDYRTLITKAKTKSPDAIFGSYAEIECVLLRQTAELGLKIPLLSTESAGTPKALTDCPELMNERLFFSAPRQGDSYGKFAAAYQRRFGGAPVSPSAVTAYDATLLLGKAIKDLSASHKEINRENIRTALATVRFDGGVSMPTIEFNEKGFVKTPPDAFEMKTVSSGQFVKVQ